MKRLKELLFGRMVTREFKLNDAMAVVSMLGGEEYRITRNGCMNYCFGTWFGINGSDELESYIRNAGNILKTDDGTMIMASRIYTIKMVTVDRTEELQCHERGLL